MLDILNNMVATTPVVDFAYFPALAEHLAKTEGEERQFYDVLMRNMIAEDPEYAKSFSLHHMAHPDNAKRMSWFYDRDALAAWNSDFQVNHGERPTADVTARAHHFKYKYATLRIMMTSAAVSFQVEPFEKNTGSLDYPRRVREKLRIVAKGAKILRQIDLVHQCLIEQGYRCVALNPHQSSPTDNGLQGIYARPNRKFDMIHVFSYTDRLAYAEMLRRSGELLSRYQTGD